MKVVNTHEAKTHLSRLLDEVASGEQIVIAKAGKPVAMLVKYEAARKPRILGLLQGRVTEAADCWEPDDDLEQSIATPLYREAVENHPPFQSKIADEPNP